MNRETVSKVAARVAEQFPEMEGVRPTVRRQDTPGEAAAVYLLTFKGSARLPNGKSLKRIVRVVADEEGQVIRISTSR